MRPCLGGLLCTAIPPASSLNVKQALRYRAPVVWTEHSVHLEFYPRQIVLRVVMRETDTRQAIAARQHLLQYDFK